MEIFGIGLGEILLIAVAALVILGPERLPEAARTLGKGIADLRRATEPARSAWNDITNELAGVANVKPSEPIRAASPKDGNPWTIHPVMAGMTEEERVLFMADGTMPDRLIAEWSARTGAQSETDSLIPEIADLSYPMPHAELASAAPKKDPSEPEDLDYPAPGSN